MKNLSLELLSKNFKASCFLCSVSLWNSYIFSTPSTYTSLRARHTYNVNIPTRSNLKPKTLLSYRFLLLLKS